jgi:hypothetical protein
MSFHESVRIESPLSIRVTCPEIDSSGPNAEQGEGLPGSWVMGSWAGEEEPGYPTRSGFMRVMD